MITQTIPTKNRVKNLTEQVFSILLALILWAIVTPVSAQDSKAITDPRQVISKSKPGLPKFAVEKLMVTRETGDADWSPDGKRVAFVSNITGRYNLWVVPAKGGWPSQLTISDQQQASPAWSPDGKWLAYISDYNGNEQWDIFLVSTLNGEVVNLTNTPEISEESPVWSPDGRMLACIAKPKTGSSYEILLIAAAERRIRPITAGTPDESTNTNPIWSRDGKRIAYTRFNAAATDSNVFSIELATGKTLKLTDHQAEATYQAHSWSPDGRKLLITSNAGSGYDNVALLDLSSKKIEWLTRGKRQAQAGGFSPDGRKLTWVLNIDGNKDIFLYDLATKRARSLPLRKGVNELSESAPAFSRDGSKLLFFHRGADTPRDVWVYSLATRRSYPVTQSLVGGLRGEDLVEPFLIHYPSTDGKWQISAFVYVPHNLKRDGKNPAIVSIHGGPASQSMNGFNPITQFIINHGYLVIVPNYRGSTGYGSEFMEANRFDVGGGDYQDVLAAAAWIKKTGYVDPAKLVIMGGSYGGYMATLGLTKSPDAWAAGVAIIPFVNWFTLYETGDPGLRQYELTLVGDPIKNKALYEDRSPIFFAERIKAPLLLLAGGNDPRCPKSEAEQMANAVKKRGGIVELKIYEDEGHGFTRIENEIDALKRVADFLKKHVPPADSPKF